MKKITIIGIVALALLMTPAAVVLAGGQQEASNSISFAGSGGYPPFNFINDDSEVIGFDVDVAAEIAKRMGKELEYKTTAWDGIIEGLRAGRYDGILGSMAVTEEREKVVDFSDPYYYSGPQLIVRKDSNISGPEDLTSDSVIGLVTGTTFEKDAEKLGVKVKLYEDDNQTLLELLNGRVDGVLTDRIVGLNAISKLSEGDKLTMVGSTLRTETMAVAFQDEDDELREQVNKVLSEMREDGTLTSISEKWFSGQDITVE